MKPLKTFSLLFLACLPFFSCAVKEAPPGGPEDKTPPVIGAVYPSAGSTRVSPDARFKITFSKPMQRDATEGAIFLSPVFWGFPAYRWSGSKTLTIIPPEKLKANTTYILTIGAGVADSHGNKMGLSQSFAFSTGTAIDSGSISGAIFSEEGSRTLYDIWAYSLGDSGNLEFYKDIPDYATQVDSSGGFTIHNIANGRYLVIAIDDKNDDLFWDPSSEMIGLPSQIISLKTEEKIGGLVFRPIRRDTSLAIITKVDPIDQKKVTFELSQPVSKDRSLSANSYKIKYLDSDSLLGTGGVYLGEENKLTLETAEQVPEKYYRMVPASLRSDWGNYFDTAGTRFTGIGTPDTVAPKILSISPTDKSSNTYEDSVIELTFSERLQVLQFSTSAIITTDSINVLQYVPIWIAPNTVRLRFNSRLPHEKKIEIRLDPHKIVDIALNSMPDTALFYYFRLAPADTVGEVSAELEGGRGAAVIGLLADLGLGGRIYKSTFDGSGKLLLPAVMPGKYRFEFFEDSDTNGEWSPGKILPFVPAERFSFLADTISVRSRWTTEIGSVSLPNLGQ